MEDKCNLLLLNIKQNIKTLIVCVMFCTLVFSGSAFIKEKQSIDSFSALTHRTHLINTIFLAETGEKTYNSLPMDALLKSDYVVQIIEEDIKKKNVNYEKEIKNFYKTEYNTDTNIIRIHVYEYDNLDINTLNKIVIDACFKGIDYYLPSIDAKVVVNGIEDEPVIIMDDGTILTYSTTNNLGNSIKNIIAHAIIGFAIGIATSIVVIKIRKVIK